MSRAPFFTSVTRRTMPSMETVVTFASGIIFLISSSWFLYAVLPSRALFPLGSACIFSSLFVALSVKAVKRKGLLVYCPRFLQQWFLNFSLLEFLTDPALKELVSKIVPLFMNPNQTELERTLKTLPPSWRKRLLTKRLVDALPTNLRAIMLPAGVADARAQRAELGVPCQQQLLRRGLTIGCVRQLTRQQLLLARVGAVHVAEQGALLGQRVDELVRAKSPLLAHRLHAAGSGKARRRGEGGDVGRVGDGDNSVKGFTIKIEIKIL